MFIQKKVLRRFSGQFNERSVGQKYISPVYRLLMTADPEMIL